MNETYVSIFLFGKKQRHPIERIHCAISQKRVHHLPLHLGGVNLRNEIHVILEYSTTSLVIQTHVVSCKLDPKIIKYYNNGKINK
jgi:hypothetical protein